MTDYAQRIHRGLVAEGFDTESDEYYDELTNRVKTSFQNPFRGVRIRPPEVTKSSKMLLLLQGLQPVDANLLG